jgi:hypothetical protein
VPLGLLRVQIGAPVKCGGFGGVAADVVEILLFLEKPQHLFCLG